MNATTYRRLCDVIYDESGIRIREGKEVMLSARLSKRIRQLGLRNDEEYLELLESDLRNEVVHLLDLVSTNVTNFFRESEHFDHMAKVYEAWLKGGQTRFRVWCAATATGEEPYTLAMTLREVEERLGLRPDTRILATDISTRALAEAKEGAYEGARMEGIPESIKRKYFTHSGRGESTWRAKDSLRQGILFRRLNLSTPPFPMRGPFDFIFCRNVMFYFDDPVKAALIQALAGLIRPDGFLYIGKSESVPVIQEMFDRVGPSVFVKGA